MYRRKILFIIVSALIIISSWFIYKFITFKSDREWNTLSLETSPAEVVDTLQKKLKSKDAGPIIILDSSYQGKVSVRFEPNRYSLINYDLFIITYKGKSVTLKGGMDFNPPYVIYKDSMYCASERYLDIKDSVRGLKCIDLRE